MTHINPDLFSQRQRLAYRILRPVINDKIYAEASLKRWDSREPSLTNPLTFNEKLRWLMLAYDSEKLKNYADKIKVKTIIKDIIGEEYVIPTLCIWESLEEVDCSILKTDCYIKCSNGSHLCFKWNSKTKTTIKEFRNKVSGWFNNDYYKYGREISYKGIKPVVFAEKIINDEVNDEIKDYKFFCFNGVPQFVQVDCDRMTNHTRIFYDMDWNIMPIELTYRKPKYSIEKPPNFETMLEICSKLSWMFPFVRIDLYDNGKVYFGELTMFPDGAVTRFIPEKYNRIFGDLIELKIPSFI